MTTNREGLPGRAERDSGCGYQGYEFGASYPDSICVGGRLFDADRCDESGMLLEVSDYIPCPMCHPRLAVKYYEELWDDGETKDVHAKALALVTDIRNNRKNGTEPWRVKP
jgi:hypothetical protein